MAETCGLFGRFPGAGTGNPADPNRDFSNAEQGIKKAEQGIKNAHRRASVGINHGAVCNAIAAILAAFTPAAPAMTMTGPGPGGAVIDVPDRETELAFVTGAAELGAAAGRHPV